MRLFWVEAENLYMIKLAQEMIAQGDKITHITSHSTLHSNEELMSFAPYRNSTLIDARNLYRSATLRAQYGRYFEKLDIDIIYFFNEIEKDFYIISDRWNYSPLSYRARKTYFRDLIRFWLGYLKSERIEGVYFPCTPHTPWELVLLYTCKYLDIPVCYLAHTAINNRSLLRDWYGPLQPIPENYLSEKTTDEILADIPADLYKDFKSDSIVTNVIKAENDAFNKQENLNTEIVILNKSKATQFWNLKHLLRLIIANTYYIVQSLWQRKFLMPMAMDKYSNMILWHIARIRHRILAKELKAFYQDNAKALDLTKPYVYFPLHLQPELTTQPEALIFEDQLLALETIVKSMPEDWLLYVKENPRQYDVTINQVSGQSFRTINDMKNILAVSEKVFFVPQSIKSAELIEKAKAVVVLTGTAGWESLISGKPCISLAHPWYSPCASCLKVQTPDEMAEAFTKVQKITQEDVLRDLAAYIHFYADRLYIATLSDPTNVGFNTINENEILPHHASAIRKTLNQKR